MNEIIPNIYSINTLLNDKPSQTSFLIVRPEGNILFGTSGNISEYINQIKELGPVLGIYLGDRHHGKGDILSTAKNLNAPIYSSEIEAKVLNKNGIIVDDIIKYEQHHLYEDLEVIPTPGHTPGALSYLWKSGEYKVLFIGDTVVPIDNEWEIWVNKPNRGKMIETMELLKTLDFNYLAVNSFAVTGDKVIQLTSMKKLDLIDSVINKVADTK